MDPFRSVVGWITNVSVNPLGTSGDAESARIFECQQCGRTYDTQKDNCSACGAKRLAPTGSAYESGPAMTCRSCGTAVDHRHERCPECGSLRFDGIE